MDTNRQIKNSLKFHGLALPDIPKACSAAAVIALHEVSKKWRQNFAPRHFMTAAYSVYGGKEENVYGRRSAKYYKRKLKSKGHSDPLVWSGNLREAFLRGSMMTKSKGSGQEVRVYVTWPGIPKYAYVTKYSKNRTEGPRMYRELTITTPDEENKLAEVFSKKFNELMEKQAV